MKADERQTGKAIIWLRSRPLKPYIHEWYYLRNMAEEESIPAESISMDLFACIYIYIFLCYCIWQKKENGNIGSVSTNFRQTEC